MNVRLRHRVSRIFVASLFGIALSCGTAHAELVGTDEAAALENPGGDRERVRAFMERPEVVKKLQSLGVSPDEAKARVGAMGDAEVHALAQKLEALPAGGRMTNTELVIIILLAVIILVLVL
jgi:uncharacterized protein DUF6627